MINPSSRNKNSLLNAVTALLMTLVNGLMGIIVTRLVIMTYGSDFNGLNATANQIINVLLVLEGGFTMASNVALFGPMSREDFATVNGVLSATARKFRKIALVFLAVGIGAAAGYAFFANSGLPREFIATIIVMTVIPPAFNLFYATKYRVLLQTQQKEYIINGVTICTIGLGHLTNILVIRLGGPMWAVRFVTMVFALLNSLLIAGYVRKRATYLDLSQPPRGDLIQGTNDVMIQRITGVIYNSAPIVFLSLSATGGTVLASVYAVYNNVFTMAKSLLHGIIDAPRLSFGQMLTEKKREDAWPVFAQYEYAAFTAVFVLLTTCCTLILPFVRLYTNGITDANYYDVKIALLMVGISVLEMLHIPSGHLINMAGQFRVSRNFQLIACTVLVLGMVVGGSLWGVYGMLAAILSVALLLCILEMGYIHTRFFGNKLGALARLLVPMLVSGVLICWAEMQIPLTVEGYPALFGLAVVFAAVNTLVSLAVGFLFCRRELLALVKRFSRFLPGRKKS